MTPTEGRGGLGLQRQITSFLRRSPESCHLAHPLLPFASWSVTLQEWLLLHQLSSRREVTWPEPQQTPVGWSDGWEVKCNYYKLLWFGGSFVTESNKQPWDNRGFQNKEPWKLEWIWEDRAGAGFVEFERLVHVKMQMLGEHMVWMSGSAERPGLEKSHCYGTRQWAARVYKLPCSHDKEQNPKEFSIWEYQKRNQVGVIVSVGGDSRSNIG